MKKYLLYIIALVALFSAIALSGGNTTTPAAQAVAPSVVEDGGGGGSVTPCSAGTYGTVAVFYNFVYGTRIHVCRPAGGWLYWAPAIQSYVYAGGSPVNGSWGSAQWACNINPYYCYVYAYVPA